MSNEKLIASIPNKTPAERKAMRENTVRLMQSGNPERVAEATTMLAALDAFEEALASRPFAERLAMALEQYRLSESEEQVLKVLLDNPGSSCAELSTKLGWKEMAWDMHMGSICAERAAWLHGFTAKGEGKSNNLALMTDQVRGEDGEIRYTMKADVVAVLAKLGLRSGRPA